MKSKLFPYLFSAVLLLGSLKAEDEKPPVFSGKVVAVMTGEEGFAMAMENVAVVEIGGSRYLRGKALNTADERYWYRGKEVLVPEKAITCIVLFDKVEDYEKALKSGDTAVEGSSPASKNK